MTTNLAGYYTTELATIAEGAALSNAVSLDGYKYFTILMPAQWTAASLTFQGSIDGTTYYNLYTDGSEVTESVAAGNAYAVNMNALAFASLKYLKIRSGTAATPVNQAAARTISIVCSY